MKKLLLIPTLFILIGCSSPTATKPITLTDEGYTSGHNIGYQEGLIKGYADGYKQGLIDCK